MPRRAFPCASCGEPMSPGRGSLPEGEARCLTCRRAKPASLKNYASSRPPEQWSCGRCGQTCQRPATKGARPKWCERCSRNKRGGTFFPKPLRAAIYERDGWTCGLCEEAVDGSLIGTRSIWRPSLDHIVPRSAGGSDDPANLRLTHFWCNSVRCDERSHTDEDFRRGRSVA